MYRNTTAAIDIRSGRGGREAWPGNAPRTVIQEDLTIIGDLQTDGHIEVDGRVIGNVNGSSVPIGESGQVEGSILADTVTILGIAVGPVQANKVRIGNSAQVVGNIFHNELTVEPGAYHEGRRPWRPNIERKPIFER
jgi:cytoskeletal protein CcmA (bactofilin family)